MSISIDEKEKENDSASVLRKMLTLEKAEPDRVGVGKYSMGGQGSIKHGARMMGIEKTTRYDTNRDGKKRQTCMLYLSK